MNTPRKKAFSITAISIMVFIFIAIYYIRTPSSEQQRTGDQVTARREGRVFIEDLHKYRSYFNTKRHESVAKALYSYVSEFDNNPDLYTGAIRPDSLHKRTTGGVAMYSILIDIYPAEITYVIESEYTDDPTFIAPITIRCAPTKQQINPSAKCIDGVS